MIEKIKSTGVIIFNTKGEMLIQLRASNDNSFPLHWDFAAGGGIDEGEDSQEAAEREVMEELGVKAEIHFIIEEHITYTAWQSEITREGHLFLYKAEHDGPFDPDPHELDDVQFFTIEEIDKMIVSKDKFHPEFLLTWKKIKKF